jgi:pimeloyl-ACP methyl ester carboxylesterase/tetratricopeptide (TPR) repeat protein
MKAFILILILATLTYAQHGHGTHAPEKRVILLEDGLGKVDHPVTTNSAEAQKFFNQGLAYLYAFNHDEGVASFKRAAELDPNLAMAYWGMSLGQGANYNDPGNTERFALAYVNLQKALELMPKASEAERAYISALSKRYSKDPNADKAKLANDYKMAMAELVKQYPDDLDAATLYAESMMNLRPWQLWSLDGKPADGTLEIVSVLEGVLKRNPNHTGANHYYIHAIEASPNPERGTAAANKLMHLAPNAGHLVHMPSHIYLRTGEWAEAVRSNDMAIVADRNYIAKSGATGIYPLMYYNHNVHMLASSHAAYGNFAGAWSASQDLAKNVGPNVAAMPMLEMFMPYPLVTLTRFQKWDEVMKYPKPDPKMLITTGFWHVARGLALADTGKAAEAEKELAALRETAKQIPATATLFTTPVSVALKVGEEMVAGEIAQAKGDRKAAIVMLRAAAASEAKVNYAEPPDWDLPVREWLGRALLRDGQFVEAEKTYREEIKRSPRNGRALFGLSVALEKQGKSSSAQLVRKEFEQAWANADTKLTADSLVGKPAAPTGSLARKKVMLKTGISMSYVETGEATGAPVILLHGITDSSVSFREVLPLLDQKFRVYALDQRGHGDSDRPETGYSMKDFASDVAAFMDAKQIRKAIVVGHSMGSFVAMQTALDHPSRVSKLVLVGTAPKANKPGMEEFIGAINSLPEPVPASFAREFVISTSSPTVKAEFVDALTAETLKLPARVWKSALAGALARDFTSDLHRIDVPVTIFWGAKETLFVRADQDALIAGLPKSSLVVYPNSGHAPHWEEPGKFAADLNRVLKGVE